MNKDTKKRIKWLTLFLIKRRLDTSKTDGYETAITFNLSEINTDLFSNNGNDKLNQVKHCLEEIGNCELQKCGEYPNKVVNKIIYEDNNKIKLIGARTENLLRYLYKRINKGKSLFGLSANNQRQTILTFMNDKTPVRIDGKPFWIFSYLIKNPKKDVSYKSLYAELKKSMPVGHDYWEKIYDKSETKKMGFINDGIDQLRKKMHEASKNIFKEIKLDIIENKRYRGAGDEPGIYKLLF